MWDANIHKALKDLQIHKSALEELNRPFAFLCWHSLSEEVAQGTTFWAHNKTLADNQTLEHLSIHFMCYVRQLRE